MNAAPRQGTVCAVIVTHQRRVSLAECLAALRAQTRPADTIVVVENASTDGSAEMVRQDFPEVELVRLEHNGGGAGGFHRGMELAHARGFDWLWLMDDDTIPTPTALEALLAPLDDLADLPRPDLLASRVEWTDGRLHPKNLPAVRADGPADGLLLDGVQHRLLSIRLASFVSVLIHRGAVERHGLPHPHYFMWGDDGEYTARILKNGVGFAVPMSVVHHKTAGLDSVHTDTTGRYYYEVRNKLLQMRSNSFTAHEKVHLGIATAMGVRLYLGHNRLSAGSLKVVGRALLDGVRHRDEALR